MSMAPRAATIVMIICNTCQGRVGNRTGKGKLTWVDGSVVEGDFKDNLPWDCIHIGINQEEIGKWINGEFVPTE